MRLAWQPPDLPAAAPFWAAAAEGRLVAPWCPTCEAPVLYPRAHCPRCGSSELGERELSGRGVVYSYGVEHRAIPGCDLEPPFVVALVDLVEGGRLVTNVLAEPGDVAIGAEVAVTFAEMEDGRRVPRFRLVTAPTGPVDRLTGRSPSPTMPPDPVDRRASP